MSATEVAIASWGVHDLNKGKHIFQVEFNDLQLKIHCNGVVLIN